MEKIKLYEDFISNLAGSLAASVSNRFKNISVKKPEFINKQLNKDEDIALKIKQYLKNVPLKYGVDKVKQSQYETFSLIGRPFDDKKLYRISVSKNIDWKTNKDPEYNLYIAVEKQTGKSYGGYSSGLRIHGEKDNNKNQSYTFNEGELVKCSQQISKEIWNMVKDIREKTSPTQISDIRR